jgi:hypothetical protein
LNCIRFSKFAVVDPNAFRSFTTLHVTRFSRSSVAWLFPWTIAAK